MVNGNPEVETSGRRQEEDWESQITYHEKFEDEEQ